MIDNTLIKVEHFHFKINTPTNSVTIPDLLSYLANYNAMATAVNCILNKNGCIGFDQIVIEVEAFNHGSFDIIGHIKKITHNPTFATITGTVVATLITKALTTDMTPTVIINNYDNSETLIDYQQLVENKDLVRARSNIAKTALADKQVKSLSITYESNESEPRTKQIDLSTLKSVIIDEQEVSDTKKNIYTNARLRIISPVLESKPASWKVSLNETKLSARMQDKEFLKLMNDKKIAFGKGDIIIADLEITTKTVEEKKTSTKYTILKVHQYPHYSSDATISTPSER